ncbi:aminopeptidase [Niastella yeongjuensis]|uniref:Aminopeptidase N n=1 Tax=Niastella yeongjuensis TaxID=354355 RepID=A0A1V9FC80_9BACT|nr:M1 family aminopeptidase [Niastella yeongjuensis]OQP55857.1 aminopeptidase [Niastella yeongjuensis]SEP47295.1 aminopeptidase N [Niastella yeongjuensis]
MRQTLMNTILLLVISIPAFTRQIVTPGVSSELSKYRRAEISNIRYQLDFQIPAIKTEPIPATETIYCNLTTNAQPLQIDFKQNADHIQALTVNGKTVTPKLENEHLVIAPAYLHKGSNTINLQFTAGDASLNRNAEYLYALFVPDRARTVFPCFDQPDLKARFALTLRVPTGWKVLANGKLKDSAINGAQTIYNFIDSDLLPTYLFSFTAGKYTRAGKQIGQYNAEFLYRETDPGTNVDSIFQAHDNALRFLETWTGIRYPFQKVGFAAIPDFQFGGMEHPGEVQYKAMSLFLKEPTKDQLIGRIGLISHETAHMWFGDLVTMQWFNDVWMKEVFANFMADKVVEQLMGSETFNLQFLTDHYPSAYGVDRTPGANPIRQQLDNLQDAGSMYGNIIYHKAPIMMRQMELLMGKDNFRKGIQEYLKKYAYNNATWNDLVQILAKYSKYDLPGWNKVWVNQPGRPVFDYTISYKGDKIDKLNITQSPEAGAARIWPQTFAITLVYADSIHSIPVNMNTAGMQLKAATGLTKPLFILFNSDGIGYGLFPADKLMLEQIFSQKSAVSRASAYVNIYENVLSGRYMTPAELLALLTKGVAIEKEETNLRLLTSYIGSLYWTFTRPAERAAFAFQLEEALWNAIATQTQPNNKKVLFRAYQNVYVSEVAGKRMYEIWKQQQPPAGIKLADEDYTALALTIALKNDTAVTVITQQRDRMKDADKKARLDFLVPSLSPDVSVRDSFFNSLTDRKNRAKEAWVIIALGYLHHPLRQSTSYKYLPQSLELVEEIQRTGDIFFPQSWLSATFGSYQTKAAWQVVQQFLEKHPSYNPRLKAKIQQATDNLYRAQKLGGG